EDNRGDLDAEGYPRRDDAGGDNNPMREAGADGNDGPEEPEGDEDEPNPLMPPFEDPSRDDDEPIGEEPNRPVPPEDLTPSGARAPRGAKHIESYGPTGNSG